MTASERIAIASDHAGFRLKCVLAAELETLGYEVVDLGTHDEDAVDYPDYADALARAIEGGSAHRGVAICGSGVGMSIALNRHTQTRAALCHDAETARLARRHNDANVLTLAGRALSPEAARRCLAAFLETEFEGGRHARRVAKLS